MNAINFGSSTLLDAGRVRLLIKVARMYHERGMRQPQIATQLHISQSRVSRLLKQAAEAGIVRTSVITPAGVHSELEEAVEKLFGIQELVVVDVDQTDDAGIITALGAAAAVYLETTLTGRDRIGISSWSSSLLATVDVMRAHPMPVAEEVVQVLGGIGAINTQSHATRLTERLAQLTGARASFLAAPGLVSSSMAKDALIADPNLGAVLASYEHLTMLLTGIGSLAPSQLLLNSGNAISAQDEHQLRKMSAVGDICLRFFDDMGQAIASDLDDRIIGISPASMRRIPRKVAVAGGQRKFEAIRGALRGQWLNVLITDLAVAKRLAAESSPMTAE